MSVFRWRSVWVEQHQRWFTASQPTGNTQTSLTAYSHPVKLNMWTWSINLPWRENTSWAGSRGHLRTDTLTFSQAGTLSDPGGPVQGCYCHDCSLSSASSSQSCRMRLCLLRRAGWQEAAGICSCCKFGFNLCESRARSDNCACFKYATSAFSINTLHLLLIQVGHIQHNTFNVYTWQMVSSVTIKLRQPFPCVCTIWSS